MGILLSSLGYPGKMTCKSESMHASVLQSLPWERCGANVVVGGTHPDSASITSLVIGISMQHPASVSWSGALPWMKHCRSLYWIAWLSLEGRNVTTKGTSIPGEM